MVRPLDEGEGTQAVAPGPREQSAVLSQVAAPETMMLVLSIEARIGECAEKIQISIPFPPLEPLIRQLTKGAETCRIRQRPGPRPSPARHGTPAFDEFASR